MTYPNFNKFVAFIEARDQLRQRRAAGKWPWTTDPILGGYRFCNINRQHDRMTILLQEWLYGQDHPQTAVEFNAVVCRLFNQAHTCRAIGWLDPMAAGWQKKVRAGVDAIKAKGMTAFNPAYIVSTNGVSMDKTDYLIERVLGNVAARWKGRPNAQSGLPSCQAWAEWYMVSDGLGFFIANQIVTDLKYGPLQRAFDRRDFVMAGPGTLRGLNRLLGKDKDAPLPQPVAKKMLKDVRDDLALVLLRWVKQTWFDDLNNLSNSFCEYDKYVRTQTGEGKPKQRYQPVEEV